ncbi:MAG: cytochrome c biogenesis CcdA family protein [Lachnospiraceae bacterium]
MQYFISFLEGIITFISPCLLPMLPIYISYFMGSKGEKKSAVGNAMGFVGGFTIVFLIMGAFAGTIGGVLQKYHLIFNLVAGGIMILFGLNFIGVFKIAFLNKTSRIQINMDKMSILSALVFGIVFAIGWTPCVGAFLGSALILASARGTMVEGILMLLSYSFGLGIPFIISAVFIDRLKRTFDFIKKNYKMINLISGLVLVLVGILLATGRLTYLFGLFS